tara:strand:+ start:147 stop:410 length:264 start_codon:yes stop_codon:yes gene_type:complete
MFPLIDSFKADTFLKAFILNALSSSIIASVAITVKDRLDTYTKYDIDLKIFLTFIITFFVSLISFSFMYILFGFGGGMMILKNVSYK